VDAVNDQQIEYGVIIASTVLIIYKLLQSCNKPLTAEEATPANDISLQFPTITCLLFLAASQGCSILLLHLTAAAAVIIHCLIEYISLFVSALGTSSSLEREKKAVGPLERFFLPRQPQLVI
jgi:hypothetical protein